MSTQTATQQQPATEAGEQDEKKNFWQMLGPGLITGASDDDPSGIATYSQAGAAFGFATLWTALITFPLMASIQEMCARIGAVTTSGLTGLLKKHYPRPVLYLMMIFSFPAIVLNIGADLQGMGAISHKLFPAIPVFAYEIIFAGLILGALIRYNYQKISSILKWLCLALLLYIFIPFLVKVNWKQVIHHTFVPTLQLNKEFFSMLVAILGTTISPYLFFWQTTMEAEELHTSKTAVVVDKEFFRRLRTDVYTGMFFSNLVMFFIILTTGAVLFQAGIKKIDTIEEAAKALEPLMGNATFYFFAAGIIGTGFLAIPVLSGSLSYIVAETFGWRSGLTNKFSQAKGFYFTIIVSLIAGLVLDFVGISPMQALLYTAILYGLTAPVMIVIVMHICNNKKIMGEETNSVWSNIGGSITLVLMTLSAIALVYFQFF